MLPTFALHFEFGLDFLRRIPCLNFVTEVTAGCHIEIGPKIAFRREEIPSTLLP